MTLRVAPWTLFTDKNCVIHCVMKRLTEIALSGRTKTGEKHV